MFDDLVTEEEIEAAETLSGQGNFALALVLSQKLLQRARDDETRMRLLFNIVGCSTQLNLTDVTEWAVRALEQLPDATASHIFVNFLRALSFIEFSRAQEALELIDANLNTEVMETGQFQERKYEHLVHKGKALTHLARPHDALASLKAAELMCPNGKFEVDILIARANCLMALERYDESYCAASQILNLGDEESATLAMQYMAECRMWQSRVSEALELYSTIRRRPPSRLVQEKRIEAGIKKGIAYLEKLRPLRRPS